MNRTDIDDTMRDMWATRPRRRRDDRKIAGVAAAIGRRYYIDPVLVRVAFVVTTIFGGVGIMLYLLGWLLLPQEGDEVSGAEALIGHGHSSMSKPLTILLAIALIPASSGIFTGHLSALLSLAVAGAAMFLLHKHRGGGQPWLGTSGAFGAFGAPAGAPTGGTAGSAAGAQAGFPAGAQAGFPADAAAGVPGATAATATGARASGSAGTDAAQPGDTTEPTATSGRTTPPAWDPLGAAPFAWDLPEPGTAGPPAERPVRRRRSAVTAVTLALALMVGGAMAIAAMTNSGVGAVEVAASTLAVVGIGLVVGSFLHGGRGLIAVAIPLGLVTYGLSTLPGAHIGPQYGVGDRHWQASSAAAVQPEYRLSVGDATLDLRDLQLANTETVATTVQLGLGDLKVLLPPDADVEVHCDAGLGEVSCLGQDSHGPDSSADVDDVGADGTGGGKIVLTASVGTGSLKVSR